MAGGSPERLRWKRDTLMRRRESRPLTARCWPGMPGGEARRSGIAARQQARLQALVEHARRASRFYAEHYRAVQSGPIQLEELDRLPVVPARTSRKSIQGALGDKSRPLWAAGDPLPAWRQRGRPEPAVSVRQPTGDGLGGGSNR